MKTPPTIGPDSRAVGGVELPEKASSAPLVVLPKEAHLQRTRSKGKFQRLCKAKSYSLARGRPRNERAGSI